MNKLVKQWFSVVLLSGLLFAMPAQAQTTSTGGALSSVFLVIGVIGLLVSLAVLSYAVVIWRSATQNNDPMIMQRGRSLAISFGLLLAVSMIFVVVGFVLRRSTQAVVTTSTTVSEQVQTTQVAKDMLLLIDPAPVGSIPLQNPIVRLLFNQPVKKIDIDAALRVEKSLDSQVVVGEWTVQDSLAIFKPNQPCLAPNDSFRCFEPQTQYRVVVGNTLTSADGDTFRCTLPGSECQFSFTTGTVVDTTAPSVLISFPFDGASAPVGESALIEAVASDDSAVGYVQFFVDGQSIGFAGVPESLLLREFRGMINWSTLEQEIGSQHAVSVIAYDAAGLGSSPARISIDLLALHCYDEAQNEDEQSVDCGGSSCRLCNEAVCKVNADCASGLCFDGRCRVFPVIDDLISSQGTVGEYITIRGRNFGKDRGLVTFLGGEGVADDVEATFPDCELVWGNEQIIIEVPVGAKTGPIYLQNSDAFFDRTDDNKGIQLDFQVTTGQAGPSLCGVDPVQQVIGEPIRLTGLRFGTETQQVQFGSMTADSIASWNDTTIDGVVVPFVETGFVPLTVKRGNLTSNPVMVKIMNSPTLPRIQAVYPDSGSVSQLITINGANLSDDVKLVFYNPSSAEEKIADGELPEVCQGLGTATQRAFRVPALETGVYEIFAKSATGKSNSLPYRVVVGNSLPGICAMVPDNGPAGIEVSFYGERLGEQQSSVRFSRRLDDAQIISWNDQQVKAIVPEAVETGPSAVIDANDNLSNAFVYTVGTCSADTCGGGQECCSNGACQQIGSCAVSVALCSYDWMFTTGDSLSSVPRVIDDATCEKNTQSPSPYRETENACINASISARFTLDMKDQTMNFDTIVARRCNTGGNFESSACDTVIGLRNLQIINSGQSGEGFVATPEARLQADTWYQVELSTAITAENNFALEKPYIWAFKTQANAQDCKVDRIKVTPATATLRKINAQQPYTGVAQALNCNILDSNQFSWRWLSGDSGKATVEDTTLPTTKAVSVAPTDPGPAVPIIGSLTEFSLEDRGLLSIKLSAPKVVTRYPDCDSACVNALLGAGFDQEMQASSLTGGNNIQLFECVDTSCGRTGLKNIGVKNIQYNKVNFEVYFVPAAGLLRAAKVYRVVLRSGIRSTSGLALDELNYDADGNGQNDAYSWTFTVRNDGTLCTVEKIEIAPDTYESFLIGEKVDYFSLPLSAPDACNANGQRLNPVSYEWSWNTADNAVASVTNNDRTPDDGRVDPMQITSSEGKGLTQVNALAQGTQGSGEFKVTCDFQNDTQCPLPATLQSHGVGKDSCCHERPKIVSINPVDGSKNVCTSLAVELTLNQVLDESTLDEHVFLEYDNGATPCPQAVTTPASISTGLWNSVKAGISAVVRFVIPETTAQTGNFCQQQITINSIKTARGSLLRLFSDTALPKNRLIRVRIVGDQNINDGTIQGVLSLAGVPMLGSYESGFTTGDRLCSLDTMEVTITPPGEVGVIDGFFCAGRDNCPGDANTTEQGNQHSYLVSGRDVSGVIVPAEYEWLTNPNQFISLSNTTGEEIEASPTADNGNEILTIFGQARSPSIGSQSKSIDIRVFVCENPWPGLQDFPYTDIKYNFDTFYCRDFGQPGTEDDLPPLTDPLLNSNLGGPFDDKVPFSIFQESVFLVQPSNITVPEQE